MDPALIVFLVVLVLAAVIAGAYYAHLREKKRREELGALAESLGWRFSPDRDRDHDERFRQFDVFQKGHSRFAYNLSQGPLVVHPSGGDATELDALAGDYHYQVTTHNGKQSQTHTYRFSFLMLRMPLGAGGDLLVRKENFGDRVKAGLGFDDIDFESVEFSDRFYVKSRDKRFAYDVIHPRMMQFLLDTEPQAIRIDGGWLCLADGSKRWEPEVFRSQIDWLGSFFEHWPRHVGLTAKGSL